MKLRQPRDGGKSFTGLLGDADDEVFHLLVGETDMAVRYDEVRQVKLVFEWGRK
jgi:ribosome maturation factor RimP